MPDSVLSKWREETWQRTLERVRGEHARQPIDLFLSYFYPGQVLREAVTEIKRLGIPCVNFFCDNVRLFRSPPPEFGVFDLNWVPEFDAIKTYQNVGYPYIHAAMPCWIPPKMRTVPQQETLPATFLGTRDEQRERLFEEAFTNGLIIDLRGAGWGRESVSWANPPQGRGLSLVVNQLEFVKRHGWSALGRKLQGRLFPMKRVRFDFSQYSKGPCSDDEYWHVLRECRVCIGVNRFPDLSRPPDRPRTYSRLRDIEAPMAGAAYLTESAPGLDELYEIGNEIEVYRSARELVEMVSRLERDPMRRRALRISGQRRALSHHSIAKTIESIAVRLGIAPN
jgi:hypothetical protein